MHVETVVLLCREKADGYVDIDLDVEDFVGKGGTATYAEIKEYVEKVHGCKISNLYIAQVKDEIGLDKRENYNLGSGSGKVSECPEEKEKAILDAFNHFHLI